MPTISYSIGGEKHDISGKSGEEVVKMVKAEYAKQKKIKFKVKKVEEEEEEEEPYLCVDCGKDFKWKSGTSSAGAGVNSYHCGSCREDEVEEDKDHNYCEKCGRPSEVWGGNPHKGMCKKCSISEGWAKWCDKHDKISYKTEIGEGCRDCKAERK